MLGDLGSEPIRLSSASVIVLVAAAEEINIRIQSVDELVYVSAVRRCPSFDRLLEEEGAPGEDYIDDRPCLGGVGALELGGIVAGEG